jgi:predicted Fe-S protein YdhL (DUF1289 family)
MTGATRLDGDRGMTASLPLGNRLVTSAANLGKAGLNGGGGRSPYGVVTSALPASAPNDDTSYDGLDSPDEDADEALFSCSGLSIDGGLRQPDRGESPTGEHGLHRGTRRAAKHNALWTSPDSHASTATAQQQRGASARIGPVDAHGACTGGSRGFGRDGNGDRRGKATAPGVKDGCVRAKKLGRPASFDEEELDWEAMSPEEKRKARRRISNRASALRVRQRHNERLHDMQLLVRARPLLLHRTTSCAYVPHASDGITAPCCRLITPRPVPELAHTRHNDKIQHPPQFIFRWPAKTK